MRLAALIGLTAIGTAACAVSPVPPARVGALVISEQPDHRGASFLGSAACGGCHPAAYAHWRQTAHAREFAGLVPADRLLPACLRCHVTAYGERRGYPAAGAPDLANVGCEACHGPGANHGRSGYPELVPTLTGGECPPCEINRICRLCHTPERSPGFELARDLAAVTCPP